MGEGSGGGEWGRGVGEGSVGKGVGEGNGEGEWLPLSRF